MLLWQSVFSSYVASCKFSITGIKVKDTCNIAQNVTLRFFPFWQPLSLCGSVVKHRSAESGFPLGTQFFFSLSHNCDKTKNIFLHLIILGFQIDLKNSLAWSPKRVFRRQNKKIREE